MGPIILIIGVLMLVLAALLAQLPASSMTQPGVGWLPASLMDADAPLVARPPRAFKPINATKVVVKRGLAWLLARLPA